MFWWYYKSPQRIENGSTPWPLVLWLQGGPVSFFIVCLNEKEQNLMSVYVMYLNTSMCLWFCTFYVIEGSFWDWNWEFSRDWAIRY